MSPNLHSLAKFLSRDERYAYYQNRGPCLNSIFFSFFSGPYPRKYVSSYLHPPPWFLQMKTFISVKRGVSYIKMDYVFTLEKKSIFWRSHGMKNGKPWEKFSYEFFLIFYIVGWTQMASSSEEPSPSDVLVMNLTNTSGGESSGSSLEDYYAGEDTEFKVGKIKNWKKLTYASGMIWIGLYACSWNENCRS